MKKAIATTGIALAIFAGATACNTNGYSDGSYVTETQYGYYDSYHHYHYYSTPHTVRVTHKYYTTHIYQYEPHGTQHVVAPKPIKTKKPSLVKRVFGRKSTSGTTTRRSTVRRTTTRRR